MQLNGTNARGARGNSKSSKGSRGRGQTGRGASNNSSAMPSSITNTTNPFEQERLENAAKREQRGQNGAMVNGRGGKGTSRGGLHGNKQVRFANLPSTEQQFGSSTTANPSETKKPLGNAALNTSNPFALSSNSTSNISMNSNVFGAPSGPSAAATFTSPFTRPFSPNPPGSSAAGTAVFGAPSAAQPSISGLGNNPSASSISFGASSFGTPSAPAMASVANANNTQKPGILKGNKGTPFEKKIEKSSPNASSKKTTANVERKPKTSQFKPSPPTTTVPATASFSSSSELASQIADLLKKEKISQPRGVKNPGDPKEKVAVKAYLDALKVYRTRVRASLIQAGFIDDPLKPKKLSEAIDFKGTCDQMCPEEEIIRRIIEDDVQRAEKELSSDGSLRPSPQKMIKKLARSAAGEDAPLPQDVRSPAALRKTLDYLIHSVLGEDENLAAQHEFLWDRTRAIRRDFVFQSSMSPPELADQVYCLEKITRFHVTALHQMSKPGAAPENFEEQQEVEQLSKSLLSLIHAYEDCNLQNIPCENEAEFRAYYVLLNSSNPGILETVQNWGWKFWGESEEIKIAVSLVEALQNIWSQRGPLQPFSAANVAQNAFSRFFTILKDGNVSYTMACFAEMHFNEVRKNVFKTILSAYHRQRDQTKDWTLSKLNTYLQFDDESDILEFGDAYGLRFDEIDDDFCLSLAQDNQVVDPFPPRKQPHSESIVEQKRGDHSLTEVIDSTVYGEVQGNEPGDLQQNDESSSEDGLFVKDNINGLKSTSSAFTPTGSPKVSVLPKPEPTFQPPISIPSPFSAFKGLGSQTSTSPATKDNSVQEKPQSLFAAFAPIAGTPPASQPTPVSTEPPKFSWPSSSTTPQLPKESPKPLQPVSTKTDAPQATSPLSRPKLNAWGSSPKPMPQTSNLPQFQPLPQTFPNLPQPSPVVQPPEAPKFTPAPPTDLGQSLKPIIKGPLQPTQPPASPVNPLNKFAEWIALGDEGLVDQFTTYTVQNLLEETMAQFQREQAKAARKEARRIAKEEEELARKEADEFRSRSLAVKYFHMWRANAHRVWLRRKGREARQARKDFAQSIRASKAARSTHVVDDFRASTSKKRTASMPSEDQQANIKSLLGASGILDGVHDPNNHIHEIVSNGHIERGNKRQKSSTPSVTSDSSTYGHSRGQSDNPFRRSLLSDPSFLSGGSRIHLMPNYHATLETRPQISGVQTDYFRLKARGITTLPNGTPMASSAAKDVLHRKHSFDGISKPSRVQQSKHNGQPIPRSSPARPPTYNEIIATSADDDIHRLKERAKAILSKDLEPGGKLQKRGSEDDEDLFERAKRVREKMDEDSEWLRREVVRYSESRSGT